ncbi:polysaccharide pyruvyl transferase family protein [Bacteroides sp. GD17]|jgi:colanic acid/amylovoran biosynthesis protein|uniref:polysaccharide pyruvyl transferase family protein n=1 Tax=Bacteroides sp. GD17 TaxID=3139826 RepID=UPI00313DF2A7
MGKVKILISVYAGITNKGTEALLRGTGKILYDKFGDNIELSMSSIQPHIDKTKELPYYQYYYLRDLSSLPKIGLIIRCLLKGLKILRLEDLSFTLNYSPLYRAVKKQDIFIEMGADNYDVEYGRGYLSLYKIHDWIRRHSKVKMLLYNCSLNKESVTTDFIREIERFDLMTIRETETLSNLSQLYAGDKAFYCPDPAFIMESKKTELPSILIKRDCVGINLSNLIVRNVYAPNAKEIALANYYYLIDTILAKTEMGILLLPHVMKNADLSVLKVLYEKYVDNDRVYLLDNEDLSAPEIKYIISHLKFLVTARTHASIAAYSTYIPTLVLGYSVKSKGIAKDLFGEVEKYVISIKNLQNKTDLWKCFEWIMQHEDEIRNQLKKVVPQYIEQSKKIGNLVKQLMK